MFKSDKHEHEHNHDHVLDDHHDHHIHLKATSYKRLWWALIINLFFLIAEAIGGILTNSLALLADAGHMLTDVGALALALFIAHIASRPATPNRTFGLMRAEVLGAFVNGATLVLIVGLILWEAWQRLGQAMDINGPFMFLVAFLGLLANIASAIILAKDREESVNIRGAFLHMVADALGSVGAIIAGIVIWTTGWTPIDPITSVVIGFLILWSSWGFLRQTMNILLEATPEHIDFLEVKKSLEEIENIEAIHDLHIWNITSGMPVLSAHISISDCCSETNQWQECLNKAHELLKERFGIEHTTLQVEANDASCAQECQLKEDA